MSAAESRHAGAKETTSDTLLSVDDLKVHFRVPLGGYPWSPKGTLRAVEEDVTGPINLCSGVATSMGNLAYAMCRHLGYRPTLKVDRSKPLGVLHRVGDPTKMNQFYTPKVSLDEGITRALEALR